jgi:uncharacterized membrane protein (UPF0127 family)
MRYIIIGLIVVVIAVVIGVHFVSKHVVKIQTADKTYKLFVEIADDSDERTIGLMEHTEFSDDKAMLFVYEKEGYPTIWMKNMDFPIDIIFIGGDLKIRQIEQNVPPCPADGLDCTRYTSSFPAQYVLEVNAGYTKRRGIKVGDTADLNL